TIAIVQVEIAGRQVVPPKVRCKPQRDVKIFAAVGQFVAFICCGSSPTADYEPELMKCHMIEPTSHHNSPAPHAWIRRWDFKSLSALSPGGCPILLSTP